MSASRAASLGSRRAPRRSASPVLRCRADQHVARAEGVTGLDAVDPGIAAEQVVAVLDVRGVVAAVQRALAACRRSGRRAGCGAGPTARRARSRGARVVVRVVEADRVRVARVAQAELPGAPGSCASTKPAPIPRPRRPGSRRRRWRSPAAAPSAGRRPSSARLAEVDLRLCGGARRGTGRRDHVWSACSSLERQQRRHQLRRAGDRRRSSRRACRRRTDPVAGVDQDRGRWLELGGAAAAAAGRGSPTGDGRERDRERDAQREPAPPERCEPSPSAQLIRWPSHEGLRVEVRVELRRLLDARRSSPRSRPRVSPGLTT